MKRENTNRMIQSIGRYVVLDTNRIMDVRNIEEFGGYQNAISEQIEGGELRLLPKKLEDESLLEIYGSLEGIWMKQYLKVQQTSEEMDVAVPCMRL